MCLEAQEKSLPEKKVSSVDILRKVNLVIAGWT